ncbi:hypothetical protein [Dysgonomonas macrotermitis]|uniref:PKD domain-containing protein n=1 Tax=Dysgonomonas macrotermitis TaxID=1346286 RepID=A0A1M5ELQ1_9BACT|nr:hypothetical protein [Dysgonomonas macrotermitis]SHF80233.1 hypothetical protein SAMN05444362_11077 [Dysgonomonas macrotermitis]
MRKIIYLSTLIVLTQLNALAQKETAWWHFGFNSGFNFNSLSNVTASDGTIVTDMPESISGPLYTEEGCFTLSTYDGQLLMSSDGRTVYDRNGNVMTNGTGLLGGSSATQSGIVVPKPGSLTQYYIITVPQALAAGGVCYSVADLSLNGGLGEITSKNNVILSGTVYENIAAVPNTNGKDYWLIHRTAQTFYVWAITSAGISATPHQTITSSLITTVTSSYVGEIIVSPDYTKLVTCTWAGYQIISSDFNPATGLISDIKVQSFPLYPFGGSFSSNNKYIYVASGYNGSARAYVNTWDNLRAGVAFTALSNGITNLRRGMDNRLYGTSALASAKPTKNIYVVLNPDDGGTNIKYFPDYLKGTGYLGLPTFAAGFIRIIPKEQPFACTAHNRTYSVEVDLSGGNAPSQLVWNFGDGTPNITQTVNSTQSKYSQVHSYPNSGIYTITITPYKGDGTTIDDITMQANIVNCTLKSNRMTRSELLNSKQQ